jgi:hypothetical protein
LKKDFRDWKCIDNEKNVEKFCDARFFGDKVTLIIFLRFQKKVEKIGKNAFFSKKSLWSHPHFRQKSRYHLSCKNSKKDAQKKT